MAHEASGGCLGFAGATDRGNFSCIDYGGSGPDCILVHGTGQNALAWYDFAMNFAQQYRVAFDMSGHDAHRSDAKKLR